MSVYVRKRADGQYQLRIRHRLLPKNGEFYATFDDEETAREWGNNLHKMLAMNVVPTWLQEANCAKKPEGWSVPRCIAEYQKKNSIKPSQQAVLRTLERELKDVMSWMLSIDWANAWIRSMKCEKNLVPNTIRHRHSALARCLDWVVKMHPTVLACNPLRLLEPGFANYSDDDVRAALENGGVGKWDVERDRRLNDEENRKLRDTLASHAELQLLHDIGEETAMRLREIYTLTAEQVRLDQRTIFLDKTKNGSPRQVPLSRPIHSILAQYLAENGEVIAGRDGRLFSWWNGTTNPKTLKSTSSMVSSLYAAVVDAAGILDFHFHDLRHEAICQLYLRTQFSDLQISRITGHRTLKMLRRYSNLRGSELADGMWGWSAENPHTVACECGRHVCVPTAR